MCLDAEPTPRHGLRLTCDSASSLRERRGLYHVSPAGLLAHPIAERVLEAAKPCMQASDRSRQEPHTAGTVSEMFAYTS